MRQLTKVFTLLLVLSAMSSMAATASAADIHPDSYGAIAYSPSTGTYGYSYNYRNRHDAEKVALGYCRAEDARIVAWVNYGYAVLVKAEDGSWGAATSYGDFASRSDAINKARRAAEQYTGSPIRTALVISSDGTVILK